MKLDAVKLGIAGGIVWGVSVFCMALVAENTGYRIGFVQALGTLYIGEQPSLLGAVLGMIYGFFDAGIGFFLLASLYNRLLGKK